MQRNIKLIEEFKRNERMLGNQLNKSNLLNQDLNNDGGGGGDYCNIAIDLSKI